MVFQSYNLFPHLNVAENIMLAPRVVKGLEKEEASRIAQDVLDTGRTRGASRTPIPTSSRAGSSSGSRSRDHWRCAPR